MLLTESLPEADMPGDARELQRHRIVDELVDVEDDVVLEVDELVDVEDDSDRQEACVKGRSDRVKAVVPLVDASEPGAGLSSDAFSSM